MSEETNTVIGEEKKTLAPLLAKLHISPASTPALLREIYSEVSIAIEDKLIADATGRNSLFKIHVSLGKIVNSLKDDDREGSASLRASVSSGGRQSVARSIEIEDEGTVVDDAGEEKLESVKVEEDAADDDEGTVVGANETRDELVEELLSDGDGDGDGDVEMSGM
jgi:condensin complex subunit 3